MVPDQLFDELLPDLSGAELKVLLYIIRRTFGFKREADAISISQLLTGITTSDGRILDRGVGLSKPALLAALRSLAEQGIIIAERQHSPERGNEPTIYRLNVAGHQAEGRQAAGAASRPPLVKKVYQGGLAKKVDYPLVKKVNPQYTVEQKTEYSNIRKRELGVKKDVKTDDPYAETTIMIVEEPIDQEATGSPEGHTVAPNASVHAVAEVLAQRTAEHHDRAQGARETIMKRIAQFAEEFGDRASLKSSTNRAYNLFCKAGVSVDQFVACLWEARSITRDRVRTGGGVKSKMGYFFTVLSERLGIDRFQDAVKPVKGVGSF
jgi:DNA-binding transcriptional ArsR family regulator